MEKLKQNAGNYFLVSKGLLWPLLKSPKTIKENIDS